VTPLGLHRFFSNDAVYHNIPMEPVQGREAIEATLADFMTMGGQVRGTLVTSSPKAQL
jgi:limonene-1,2-epoxide hydrolase